jgi:hypothetical protein
MFYTISGERIPEVSCLFSKLKNIDLSYSERNLRLYMR